MNTSICSCSSTSTTSVDLLSFIEESSNDRKDESFQSFLTEVSGNYFHEIEQEEDDDSYPDPFGLDMESFSTNPTLSESSLSFSSSTLVQQPPDVIDVKSPRCNPQPRSQQSISSLTVGPKSSRYAQLCVDPSKKTLVTMLEINASRNERTRRIRLPLDLPTPEDFPWLHPTSASISSGSNNTASSLSGDGRVDSNTNKSAGREGYCEPIVLSGPWLLQDSMTDEEADIYWLLREGEDVWVNVDDGCGKVIKKVWTSCINTGQWKLKSETLHQSSGSSSEAREEKRFRYSILN